MWQYKDMPELPEVETLRQELSRAVIGKKIKKVEILVAKTVKPLSEKDFKKQVTGKEIKAIKRQAKILVIDLNGQLSLAIHLKMTGQLIFVPKKGHAITGGHPDKTLTGEQPNKFTRLFLEFTDGSHLYFNDIRKFGWVRLINDEEVKNLVAGLGIEP
jgi:formamidopyrimidine-DNA glycosylase